MPAGTNITSSTFAAAVASDDGKNWYSNTAPANMLINGTNVCAVEIHQSDSTSSDISFMLQLTGNILTPIKIQLRQFRKDAFLDWDATNTILEYTDSFAHPWRSIIVEPPVSIDFSAPQGYYRLRKM